MITPDNPYYRQVQLLVRVLPVVAAEECFALKGGTAINLFVRDLPRLSVDIDLAFLPITEFDVARRQISEALGRIRDRLAGGSPAYKVTAGTNDRSGHFDTLNVSDGAAQIKIEVNPVLRGSLDEPVALTVRAAAEETFGFAEIKTLSFADLYGGKLMAAIDRQHPRDLFDVKLLLENEGMSDALFRSFFVYLIGHKGSLADSLDPNRKDIRKIYEDHFRGMTAEPVSIEELEQTRERLIDEIHERLGEREKQFLLSMKRGEANRTGICWSWVGRVSFPPSSGSFTTCNACLPRTANGRSSVLSLCWNGSEGSKLRRSRCLIDVAICDIKAAIGRAASKDAEFQASPSFADKA